MDSKLERPNYYGILPADVRYDSNISPSAKILFTEITALTNMKGVCWATNKYFANLYGVQPTRISVWIKQLETAGFVTTKTIKGGLRAVYLSRDPYGKAEGTLPQKQKHNNQTNNTSYVKLQEDLLKLTNRVLNREFRVLPERGIKKTLDAFTLVEIESALVTLSRDDWHKDKVKELKLDYFLRATTIDKFLAIAKKKNITPATVETQEQMDDRLMAEGAARKKANAEKDWGFDGAE